MSARIRYNFNLIRGFLKSTETQRVLLETARKVEANAKSQGAGTRVDSQLGQRRARAAVIAGYERGATAESTRRVLLRSLDIGGGE